MTREEVIQAIIDEEVDDKLGQAYILARLLRFGFRGYMNMTDEELNQCCEALEIAAKVDDLKDEQRKVRGLPYYRG